MKHQYSEDDIYELKEVVRQYVMGTLDDGKELDLYDFQKQYAIRELTGKEEGWVWDWIEGFEKEWQRIQETEKEVQTA